MAIGVPDENLGAQADAGAVSVIYGATGGLAPGPLGHSCSIQNSAGMPGVAERGDRFRRRPRQR